MDKNLWLKNQHTKQLLDYLNMARKFGGGYNPFDNEICFSIDEIKTELSTREHIPNKNEGRRIRQLKATKQSK